MLRAEDSHETTGYLRPNENPSSLVIPAGQTTFRCGQSDPPATLAAQFEDLTEYHAHALRIIRGASAWDAQSVQAEVEFGVGDLPRLERPGLTDANSPGEGLKVGIVHPCQCQSVRQ